MSYGKINVPVCIAHEICYAPSAVFCLQNTNTLVAVLHSEIKFLLLLPASHRNWLFWWFVYKFKWRNRASGVSVRLRQYQQNHCNWNDTLKRGSRWADQGSFPSPTPSHVPQTSCRTAEDMGHARCRRFWGKVSSELAQDRRSWSAFVRYVVNAVGDAISTRLGWMPMPGSFVRSFVLDGKFYGQG